MWRMQWLPSSPLWHPPCLARRWFWFWCMCDTRSATHLPRTFCSNNFWLCATSASITTAQGANACTRFRHDSFHWGLRNGWEWLAKHQCRIAFESWDNTMIPEIACSRQMGKDQTSKLRKLKHWTRRNFLLKHVMTACCWQPSDVDVLIKLTLGPVLSFKSSAQFSHQSRQPWTLNQEFSIGELWTMIASGKTLCTNWK